MDKFLKTLTEINSAINDFVWVKTGLIILIGTGILLTCCTGFFQVTHLRHWWRETIGSVFRKNNSSTKKRTSKQFHNFRHYVQRLRLP